MKILVINAGSSSLKYQLIDMLDEKALAKGNCERIGIDGFISHKTLDGRKISEPRSFPTHTEAFYAVVDCLTKGDAAVIENISEIDAIGHRIVQGAEKFTQSTLITPQVLKTIEDISDLAPLHNPAHVLGIKACQVVFGMDIPEVAVFDTSFHSHMPETSYMYPIPYEYYEKYHIRKYGFHGTSHRFVSDRYAQLTCQNIKDLKLVSCHLGNGSSICAIDGGISIDTSMGFTPLDGIIMGTRSGSVDPSVIAYISEKENLSAKEVVDLLNKKSGYLGVSGVTNDHRDVSKAASEGNKRAALAEHIQHYQIKKYIGAYAAAMGGIDGIIFTGGIGENAISVREAVCSNLSFMGVEVSKEYNTKFSGTENEISSETSKVKVWIIPTNEELLIARDTKALINA